MRALLLCCTMTAGVLMVSAQSAGAQPADTATGRPRPPDEAIAGAFDEGEHARALRLLERENDATPNDPTTLYNMACALSLLNRTEEAAEAFLDAISCGFVDFFHAERDPHLAALRGHERYRAVIANWRRVLDARAGAEHGAAADALGIGYTKTSDTDLRLNFVSALPEDSLAAARAEIERVAAWAEERVLPAGWNDGHAERPDPWVLVVLPTPADFRRLVGLAGVGGYYDRDRRRLIAQDIGATLRHEFFHVMHWRHMDRIGQRHPYWIMEGLAGVPEDIDAGRNDSLIPAASWRTNIVKRLERANRLAPLPRLASMERSAFMGSTSRAHYAHARCVFMYLEERGLLREWYAEYTATFGADPSGLSAIERVTGEGLSDFDRGFRAWARSLPEVAEIARPSEADLGVELAEGPGDGVVVAGIVAASRAEVVSPVRLRRRDVILSIDGVPVRSLDDYHRLMTGRAAGEEVVLEVRRANRRLEVRARLVAREPG